MKHGILLQTQEVFDGFCMSLLVDVVSAASLGFVLEDWETQRLREKDHVSGNLTHGYHPTTIYIYIYKEF